MSASCVLCDCTNYLSRKVTANLFRFPSKLMYPEKRAAWVAAVRKVHPDGSLWEPSPDSQICSAHFITGRPSNFKDRPDFVPTVFNYSRAPGESAEQSQDPCVERHEGDGATLLGETNYPLKVTEDIWFGCCSCTYVTRDQHGIVNHLAAHGDEQFKCQHPSMSGSKSQVLGNTQKYKIETPFKCKLCPQEFAYNSLLTRHNRTHTGEKPFKCKQCPIAFARNSNLIKHNRIHIDEKRFKCKHCPLAFAQICHLRIHNRTHIGEKPFKCKQCPQAFAQDSHLQNHNRTHTGERPFKCKQCPKDFAQYSCLRNHNKTHTGEKPFKCKQCPKAFARNSHLQRHNHLHTREKPFKCKQCPQAFPHNASLIRHYRTHSV